MGPIETFEYGGFRFVDYRNAPAADVRTAKDILWRLLVVDILHRERPGVDLCRATTSPDNGTDPRLPAVNFVTYRDAEIVGMFGLYNMSPFGYGWQACPMPGFHPTESWGDVMAFLLENDVTDVDGTVIDLRRWCYPTNPGHAWAGAPVADLAVSKLDERGHTVRRNAYGRPTDAKRRGR